MVDLRPPAVPTLPPLPPTPAEYIWGTVTSAAPLAVRLDGDAGATPAWEDLSGPRAIGARVYCQVNNRRLTVLGPIREDLATTAYVDAAVIAGSGTIIGAAIGAVQVWPGSTATIPLGWVLCDGRALSRTTYASLYATIGTTYGAGDGTTTFNVPDFRNRAAVGQGTGTFGTLGASVGAETLPAHTHTINHDHPSFANGLKVSSTTLQWESSAFPNGGTTGVGGIRSSGNEAINIDIPNFTGNSGSTGTGNHGVVQPSLVINFIIKAQMLAAEVQGLDTTVRNLEVTGTLKGFYRAVELGANVNLDSVVAPGPYIQPTSNNATVALNYPENTAGHLEVSSTENGLPAVGFVFQRYTTWGSTAGVTQRVWTRRYYAYNGTWGPWNLVGGSFNTDITFTSGWGNYGQGNTPVSRVYRTNDMVTLPGGLLNPTASKSITNSSQQWGSLPLEWAPKAGTVIGLGRSYNASTTHFQVYYYTDGKISILSTPNVTLSAGQYIVLSSVTWSVS